MTVLRIRVDYNEKSGRFMAIKDYGDDAGYLEEIGAGDTPVEAMQDLLRQGITYTPELYTIVQGGGSL